MKKTLISIAVATTLFTATAHTAYAGSLQDDETKQKQYIGMGIGATAGAIIAGPVGLIAGGLIGGLIGHHNAESSQQVEFSQDTEATTQNHAQDSASTDPITDMASQAVVPGAVTVASTRADDIVIYNKEQDSLHNVLADNISMDVFFRTGSIDVGDYYQPRLKAISQLMQSLPKLEIHLDGYSDRRGDKRTNLELSNQRLESVRAQLVQAGVDVNRVHTHAHGEQKFISAAGDLEAYTFDRRVVIRFEHVSTGPKNPVALMENTPVF